MTLTSAPAATPNSFRQQPDARGHFGDYGGLPLKLLWAVLTLFTIIVLGSGLYLWLGKRRAGTDALVREVESGGDLAPAE